MRFLLRSVAVISALSLPLIAHATGITYTAIPTLTDITNPGNITASFSNPTLTFIDPPTPIATDDFTVYAPIGNYTDEVKLDVAFTTPGTGTGTITGDASMYLFWIFSGGNISWDTASDVVHLSNGSIATISIPGSRHHDSTQTSLDYCGESTNCGDSTLTVAVRDNDPAVTPEPSSLMLLGTGVLGAAGMLRRRFTF